MTELTVKKMLISCALQLSNIYENNKPTGFYIMSIHGNHIILNENTIPILLLPVDICK